MKIILRLKQNYFLTIILFVSAISRFYHIDYQSLWLDEIHVLNEANLMFSSCQIYDALLGSEPHPPMYFCMVHYMFLLFGYTAFVLIVFLAIIVVLGIYSIYLLGTEIFDKKVGIYASGLLSVNCLFHLYHIIT